MITESNDAHKGWLEKPKLRPVEIIPFQDRGQRAVFVRDPSRIAQESLILSPGALAVLPLMDGTNDLRDIQLAVLRSYGQMLEMEQIRGLVDKLDEKLFLEGRTFDHRLAQETEEFAALTIRPPVLAGQSYPDEREQLFAQLSSYYLDPKGPGQAGPDHSDPRPVGLVAPHIDFSRGGPCYAWAYQELAAEDPPDLVVILGTAHSFTQNMLAVCGKDFATPFGPARCDRDLVGELTSRLGELILADAFVHRGEHSVEFQMVWLMSLFSQARNLRVVPFLCGSFHQLIAEGLSPDKSPEYEQTVKVLKERLDEQRAAGRRVLVLASADLSHVGPQFGGREPVTGAVQREIKAYDLALLEKAIQGDHQAFYDYAARNRDRTNVCGLASIYTLLRLLETSEGSGRGDTTSTGEGRVPGRLLAYDQWCDETGQGLVSFASLVYT